MRIAALSVSALLLVFGGCATTAGEESPFVKPNSLMAEEIESRVQQIPFQHREELLQNMVWLAQTGESTIPALLRGLQHNDPKVRSSCAWVLGRIHDRRTIPQLQAAVKDSNETVRLEVARQLVAMGDLQTSPTLIEGLDSDKKEVRYLCHEALKGATGRDFGYDHLSENETQRRVAVLGWRTWWSDFSGDKFFASNYQERFHLNQPAQPMGEGQQGQPQDQSQQQNQNQQNGADNSGVILVEPQGQGQNGQGQGNGNGGTPPTPNPTPTPAPTPTPDSNGTGGTGNGGTNGTGTNGTGNGGNGTTGTGTTGHGGGKRN